MKRAFLYVYDKTNLGDDLFIDTIANRYTKTRFYIWTNKKNKKNFAHLKNVCVVDKESPLVKVLDRIRPSFAARYRNWLEKRCSASIYIGGSIFAEYKSWSQYVEWLSDKAEKHRFYVLGANFGPYHTEEYRLGLKNAFSKMGDVCFRDRYSFECFAGSTHVRFAPDILFAYPMPKRNVILQKVFVSVIDCEERLINGIPTEGALYYVRNLSELLKAYLDDGCSLVLCSFCREEGDEKAIQKILDAAGIEPGKYVRIIRYDGTNVEEIVNSIAESEYVIASRFHAVILSLVAGRPVLPLIYSDKTKHVLDDIGFNGTRFDIREQKTWSYRESKYNWDSDPWKMKDSLRIEAEQHFARLDEILD